MAETVKRVDEFGRVVDVPADIADTFGGRELTQQESQAEQIKEDVAADPLAQVGSFATGALEGLSAGMSSPAVALAASSLGGGISYEEAAQGVTGLQEAAPVASGIGQVAGALGQAYLTGGASLAGEGALAARIGASGVGRVIGATGSKIAAGGLVGAAEGFAQGSMYGFSRGLMDDGELTAERVLMDGFWGAAAGGALGAAVPAVTSAAGAGIKKIAGSTEDLAANVSRQNTIQSLGARPSDVKKLGNVARQDAIADTVRNYTFKTGERQGQQLLRAGARTEDILEPLTAAVAESDQALKALKRTAFKAAAEIPEAAPDVGRMLQRIDEEVVAPLRGSMLQADKGTARKIETQLKALRSRVDAGEAIGLDELDQFRGRLYEFTHPPKPPGGGIATVPQGAAELDKVQKILSDEVKNAGEKALTAAGDVQGAANFRQGYTELNHLLTARELAEKAQAMNAGAMPLSLTSQIAGAAGLGAGMSMLMSGNLGGLLMGPGFAAAHKLVKERGSSTLAVLAKRFEQQNFRLDGALKRLVTARPDRAARTVAAQRAAREKDRESFSDAYKRMQAIQRAGTTGRVDAASKAAEPYAQEYPQLAANVARKATAVMDLAMAKMPPALTGKGLQQHLETPRIPKPDQQRFVSYMRGLEDPIGVVEDLAAGEVDRDAIDAMKQAYPAMWSATREEVMNRVADMDEELARGALMPLALAFDFVADARSDGPTIMGVQAIMSASKEADQAKRDISPDVIGQMQTQQERLGAA